MIADLPDPNHAQLPHSPLELVVWQLQFAEPLQVMDPEIGTGLQVGLSADDPDGFRLERLNLGPSVTVAFGQGAVAPPEPPGSQEGWRLQRGELIVTLVGNALTLESRAYTVWDDLRAVIERTLESLTRLVAPQAQQRVGLRFVDKIVRPEVETARDWEPWIESWLLGPLQNPDLGPSVSALAQQFEFDAGSDLRIALRSRIFPDPERRGRSSCLLDSDAFRLGYRVFDKDDVLETSDSLNILSLQVFQAAVTQTLYEALADPSTENTS